MAKKTKLAYQNHLNEVFPYYQPFMEYLTTKSNKVRNALDRASYGNILRKHDPIAFEVGFNDWKNNN
jgi:hypothetical protein